MNKPKEPTPTTPVLEKFTGTAVAAFKTDELLAEAVELEIVDGVVVSAKRLCRGPDLPVNAISQGTRILWKTHKTNKGIAQ